MIPFENGIIQLSITDVDTYAYRIVNFIVKDKEA